MSRNSARPAQKFLSRMLAGCIIGVILGFNMDEFFHTTPLITFALLLYVIIGSLYLLVRETRE